MANLPNDPNKVNNGVIPATAYQGNEPFRRRKRPSKLTWFRQVYFSSIIKLALNPILAFGILVKYLSDKRDATPICLFAKQTYPD